MTGAGSGTGCVTCGLGAADFFVGCVVADKERPQRTIPHNIPAIFAFADIEGLSEFYTRFGTCNGEVQVRGATHENIRTAETCILL